MSDELKRYEAARRMVDDLCMGSRRWIMRVPVPDNDPDLVISASLEDVPKLVAELEALKAKLAAARARIDEVEARNLDYYVALMELDPSWTPDKQNVVGAEAEV